MGDPFIEEILREAQSHRLRLSGEQYKALSNMQTCRTIERGGRLMSCPNCGTQTAFYNPCNQRGCPTCYRKNQLLWKKRVLACLAPVSHFHLTFSIPQEYTAKWLQDKKAVISCLFKSVQTAIKALEQYYRLRLGYILVFQSHGRGMSYKPHIHCLLTAGGLSTDNQWVDIGSIKYSQLSSDLRQSMEVRLPAAGITKKKDWNVYSTFHKDSGKWIVEYLSQSFNGVVINMEDGLTEHKESGMVSIKEDHQGTKIETILTKMTFIERYLNHIPPASSVMVRYCGLYSHTHRKDLDLVRAMFSPQQEEQQDDNIIEKCPICSANMLPVFVFSPMTEGEFIKKIGFSNGPPKHGEIIATA